LTGLVWLAPFAALVPLGIAGLAGGAGIAACGSSPPPVLATEDGDGGVVVHLDAGGTRGDAGTASGDGSAGADGSAGGDGSASTDDGAASGGSDAATDSAPLCLTTATIGTGVLAIGTPDPDLLGAVTPDERVVAWTSIPSDGGGPSVNWVERASASAAFGAVQSLDPSLGPFPFGKVGLSGDGLRLLVPSADYTKVMEITRPAFGTPFATLTDVDFPSVNPTGGLDGTQGLGPFVSVALSPDFGFWAFVNNGGFVLSIRQAGVWPPGSTPPGFAPASDDAGTDDAGDDAAVSHAVTTVDPTGWSSDDQSLFFWDQTLGAERIAWRDRVTHVFDVVQTIGTTQQYAYPAAGCSKIYYSATGANGDPDIFVAPFQ
jgi:hypothetical protein